MRNIYELFMCFKNIWDPNPYSENCTRSPPLRATLWFAYRLFLRYLWMELRDIYVLFMCFKNIIDLNFFLIDADYTSESHRLIQAPPVLPTLLDVMMLHLCALWIYKTRDPITKIHQLLSLEVHRWHQLFSRYHKAELGFIHVLLMCFKNIRDRNRY